MSVILSAAKNLFPKMLVKAVMQSSLVQGEGKGEVHSLTDPRAVPLKFHRERQLRSNQTDTERILWNQLRARRLNELRFRRQFPIGNFIADFCCKEYQLVIELDGRTTWGAADNQE
jgi:very-short-patch-repair endonuclease